MDTFKAIESRRSIRLYDPKHKMTAKEKKKLLSLAMCSPTALNIQHWRFVVVEDKSLREKIRAAAWDQPQVTDASLLLILTADTMAWKKNPERYWMKRGKRDRDTHVEVTLGFYKGRKEFQRDEAIRSCSMAAQTLMIAAKAMGYDSCPMDGFDFKKVARLIKLPKDHIITMFVVIGKATEKPPVRAGQLPMKEVVIKNRF
jgi:nitroreductase